MAYSIAGYLPVNFGTMPVARLAAVLACFPLIIVTNLPAQTGPAFTGYVTSSPGTLPYAVDGRPLLLSDQTNYPCKASGQLIELHNNVPSFPADAEIAVRGRWNKDAGAYRATELCVTKLPPKTVSGHGTIDAVSSIGGDMVVNADGRRLHLPVTGNAALSFAAPLHNGDIPSAGEWMEYTADRLPDGNWTLRKASIREYLDTGATRRERKWKPLAFTAPQEGHEGAIRPSHLERTIKLSGDTNLQKRVERVGNTVVPAWEKKFAELYPDERQFHFYAAEKLYTSECQVLPDATILIGEADLKRLPDDAQLAAVLAGCVAEMEEEQVPFYANQKDAVESMEIGALFATAGLAGVAGGAVYEHHMEDVLERQRARVALSYLQASGYPLTAGADAWERLESKSGEPNLSRPPGKRAAMMYEALAQEGYGVSKAPESQSASVLK